MFRRSLNRIAKFRNAPIFNVLQSVMPSQLGEAGKIASKLHKHNVLYTECWKELSAEKKAAIYESGVARDVIQALDTAVAEGVSGTTSNKKVLILFGSQTGTAEAYARMLGTYAVTHGFTPIVCSMNDAVSTLKDSPKGTFTSLLVVCSTYGTGEFPSNAQRFWAALEAGQLTSEIKDIPFAILGLGNSQNERFNAAARSLHKKLSSLGAKSFLRTHLSCELQPNGHDATFRSWKRAIWTTGAVSTLPLATYRVSDCSGARPDEHIPRLHFAEGMVHTNTILTPETYSPPTCLLKFEFSMRNQIELLGRRATISDHVQIIPKNSDTLVDRAIKRLQVNPDLVVEIAPLAGAPASYFDGHKMTVRTLLREVTDLSCIPSRSLLEILSSFAADDSEKAQLMELADDLGADSKYDKLAEGVFSIMDALEMFPSIKLNLDQVVTHLPHIAARTYSLCTDNADGGAPSEWFEVLYNVPCRTTEGRAHRGLATHMLENLRAGQKFHMTFVPSGIPLPKDENPLVLVALGSGVGTARSILQHRAHAKAKGKKIGPAVLYHGFRHAAKDQIFAEDLAKLKADGVLTDYRPVASHDQKEFITPMDTFDNSIADFLGDAGEVFYCGLGGSAPLQVENSFRRVGVDAAALRISGRYHEEYFTADHDMENLFKNHSGGSDKAKTLSGRMGKCDMFCMQCEQTFKNRGCFKIGVCGKTPRVANLQDLAVHGIKILGFYAHELRALGAAENPTVNHLTLYGLFTTLTNVNFDESRFVELVGQIAKVTGAAMKEYETLCAKSNTKPKKPTTSTFLPAPGTDADKLVELGRAVGVLSRFGNETTQNAAGVTELIVYGLKGLAAYTDHSLMNLKENASIYAYMHKALNFLIGSDSYNLGTALELALECGKVNVTAMGQLYDSNKTLGVPTPTSAVIKPVPGKCILVSGHDLIILKGLLELTEKEGINVYTHGEMLPAHSYPELKKYKTLAGHFGGAWMRQSVEFPHFPGPVLMTTNCLTEPHESYGDRLFTAGAVGWSKIPHIGNNMSDIKFDAVIAAAKKSPGFGPNEKAFSYPDPVGQKRPASYMVGFGHETILSVAPTIIEQIKKGNITRFFLVGGCDGFEGQRSYYTDLVAKLPPTAVILTLGCGKFRVNHLDLGTIGDTGIPRILDMGQCNDSYSAVQVALALADALKCKVSDLPLSIVLSWFEQKAVAVLLSCLHLGLKPIHIGPSLPAFITPDVLQILVEKFGVVPIGKPEEDAKAMCAAAGAS